MERELFDRETVLDLTVNFIPLGILLVFIVLYLGVNPFGFDSVISTIQFTIIGAMFVALAVLTYFSGAAVSRAEKEAEAALEGGADDPELEGSAADAEQAVSDAEEEPALADGDGGDEA